MKWYREYEWGPRWETFCKNLEIPICWNGPPRTGATGFFVPEAIDPLLFAVIKTLHAAHVIGIINRATTGPNWLHLQNFVPCLLHAIRTVLQDETSSAAKAAVTEFYWELERYQSGYLRPQ
jgi:hypothetical protein